MSVKKYGKSFKFEVVRRAKELGHKSPIYQRNRGSVKTPSSFYIKSLIMATFVVSCFLFSGCHQKDNASENSYTNTNEITTQVSNSTLADRTNDEEDLHENMKTYKNERFGFSVEYPEDWSSKEIGIKEAASENESSPDGGIEVYPDKKDDERIYVYGQIGHINLPSANTQEEFVTNGYYSPFAQVKFCLREFICGVFIPLLAIN